MESLKKEATLENIADTYHGRPWEEVPTEELEAISHISIGAVSQRLSQKAKEILEERKAVEESAKKALDDGSVKGLIISRDYTNVGEGVAIQNIVDEVSKWTICGGGCCSSAMTVTPKDKSYWKDIEEAACNVCAFCRRKFKKEDIILFSVDSFYSPMTMGIVFLEDKMCTFDQKMMEYIITYAEMENVDFTEDSVTIRVTSGEEVNLYCGNDEKYSKGIYNLLMDIKDRIAEA